MSLVGTRIAHFLIEEQIGQGGMGAVYAAVDERLKRRVALKALRRDRVGAEARARFLREARILSQLDHPNVCRVYEYLPGAEADYLALELVAGRSLRELLASGEVATLAWASRLSIAEQLAQALAAAHAKGIVHRDLKPENVMLTPFGGGEGYRVRVLDFGLAHSGSDEPPPPGGGPWSEPVGVGGVGSSTPTLALPPSPGPPASSPAAASGPAALAWHSSYVETEHGSLIGTLAYMSPEQARGEAATPASDVYALGLLLQELFTGERAYPADTPFLRLRERVAGGERSGLPSRFDRDLAALLGRMFAADPTGRPTAAEVALRLVARRARPARRLRRGLAAAALLLVVGGLAKYAWDLRRERNRALAAQTAEAASRRQAEAVAHFLVDLFEVNDPSHSRGATVTARELLDRAAEKLPQQLADQPLVRARMAGTMGVVYCRLGLYDRGVELATSALATRRAALPEDDLEVAEAEGDLATCLVDQGKLEEAASLNTQALTTRELRLGKVHADVAQTLSNRGLVFWHLGRLEEAQADLERALEIWRATKGEESTEASRALNNLAEVAKESGRPADAETLLLRSLAIKERLLAANDPLLASTLNNLGEIELAMTRYPEAEAHFDRALAIWEQAMGPQHPNVAVALNNLAAVYDETERSPAAEAMYRRVLAIYQQAFGADHYGVGIARNNLADVCKGQGRLAEAEREYRLSLAVFEKALGAKHALLAHPLLGLAECAALDADALGRSPRAHGRRLAAVDFARRAVAVREQALGAVHPDTVAARKELAELVAAAAH